jgi:SagB-type dehydrogenase family enzyme
MENNDTQVALRYHNGTKHPNGFLMDPHHQFGRAPAPRLFKKYLEVVSLKLDLDPTLQGIPALEAIAVPSVPVRDPRIPDVDTLARLLYFSAGITKRIKFSKFSPILFRAAACTGALYHIELYLVCKDLPGLGAGLYHFDPSEMSLDVLRQGDYRKVLVDAAGGLPELAQAPVILIYSDVFWRNACKYQAREYRHAFWDSGTILSHSLAMAASQDIPHHLALGFVDQAVNRLLDVDTQREVTLALLGIGYDPDGVPSDAPQVEPLNLETVPISRTEIEFPPILEMHRASSLESAEAVVDWRVASPTVVEAPASAADLIPLPSQLRADLPTEFLEQAIRRRGSSRRFAQEAIPFEVLATLLRSSTQGLPADFLGAPDDALNQVYLIVNAVQGLEAGAYVHHRGENTLQRLRAGNFRRQSRTLALDQALGGDCAAALYFLTDLERVLSHYGNRGYRAAQLEASLTAGRMYLAAYAQGFGATGLTFYDDAVTDFFSPHAVGKSVMFLIAVGVPGKR